MATSLASETPVIIPRHEFNSMLHFARLVYALKNNAAYLKLLDDHLPETAKIKTAWPSVLMGYDFHLTKDGPKLIEINNNAAGLFSWRMNNWLEQPDIVELEGTLLTRINAMFPQHWRNIVIIDESIEEQFFYYEMQAYARVLRGFGRNVWLASPNMIQQKSDGFLYVEGNKIDGIYNRHTDFYLESQDMHVIRKAYAVGNVGLSPHPRSYALTGDKMRMVDWWKDGFLESLNLEDRDIMLIHSVVPMIKSLSDFDVDEVWVNRNKLVFKPNASHGGKGVLIGKSVRKKRFQQMLEHSESVVVQEFVPAPTVEVNQEVYKFDVRLYMCGETLIGIAARLFQGAVTNFRHPGSGFYPICVEEYAK